MLRTYAEAQEPLILLVPGLFNSGPDHWQTQWEGQLPNSARVELGLWDDPQRNAWVNQLNLAIHSAGRPVILVAHSLGCHAVSWWAEYERPDPNGPVKGALLVAPPEVENPGLDDRLARFAPVVKQSLPFPSIVVASRDDPYIAFGRARRLARIWKSRFVDAGWLGHINSDSNLREWPFGLFLLRQLRDSIAPALQPLVAGGNYEALLRSRIGTGVRSLALR
ncbi:MAG: alpha/beta hydrolase [Porphyrobacter sp.]|nr:alpha/beta hydrolase [Porphyrobacter sp.]